MVKSAQKQRGFTLIEISIAVVILAILSAGTFEMLGSWQALQRRTERKQKIQVVASTIRAAAIANSGMNYYNYAGLNLPVAWLIIDASHVTQHPVPVGTCAYVLCVLPLGGSTGVQTIIFPQSVLNENAAFYLTPYLPAGADISVFNDSGNRFYLAIKPGTPVQFRGHTLQIPKLYVVSAGDNGKLDSVLYASGSTSPVVGGDDLIEPVDLMSAYTRAVDDAYTLANTVKAGMERYYQSRYLADTSRDSNRDYFGPSPDGLDPGSWDSGSLLPAMPYAVAFGADNARFASAIGLSLADLRSPMALADVFGTYVTPRYPQIQVSGMPVRDPRQGLSAPYGARISVPLPFILDNNFPAATAVSTF